MSKKKSLRQAAQEKIKEFRATEPPEAASAGPDLAEMIRRMRREKKLTQIGLCRISGELDPRTLNALEKGRIKNPSIKTLEALARGLDMPLSGLLRRAEMRLEKNFYQGSARGFCQLDFPAQGFKLTSLTPLVRDFFCGKLILGSRRRLPDPFEKPPVAVFVSVLIGRFEIRVEDKTLSLREGENLYFKSTLAHELHNPLERESVLLLMTSPSFL